MLERKGSPYRQERDLVIVGGGPAGMAAAISAYENGIKDILLLERDQYLGGILNQCIHTGFEARDLQDPSALAAFRMSPRQIQKTPRRLNYFKEILTGPEYADRFIKRVKAIDKIEISLKSFVVHLTKDKVLTFIKPGVIQKLKAKALVMATGARERTREMLHIPGARPAGIFSAGLAQRLINIEGFLPGNEVVVVGSGDIGLIMARRFSLEGARVKAVIEIQKQPRGLIRNIVQCVEDFDVPFYLRHKISRIYGRDRVEQVEVVRVDENFRGLPDSRFQLKCDTLLISVGLIPENELIEMAEVEMDKKTNAPLSTELNPVRNPEQLTDGPTVSNGVNQTSIPGLFVCGNASKIYDLVDSLTKDSMIAGRQAAVYLKNQKTKELKKRRNL